ncbi:hypothetical protein [Nocardia sp. CY41]|uniref:hypothetical protein n=1 Tax=Nocardia sp. CY41 TaxID=2608686 RepID=UPI00135A2777|nr:hypothetical protein [Nocardia sp. CY41]
MPELPKLVTLDLAKKKLFIDGVEFPWHISEEGPTLHTRTGQHDLRRVTLTFYAEDAEVIPANSQGSAEKPQVALLKESN